MRPCHIYILLEMLLLLLFCNEVNAQQGNVWAFGYKAGLDFNFSPPKPIKTEIDRNGLNTLVSASIADCRGKLLFYSEGRRIFNNENKVTPNGLLYSKEWGGVGGLFFVQAPKDTNLYYFIQRYDSHLVYTIIDKRLDSGRGDVDTTRKLVKIHKDIEQWNSSYTIVPHSNGNDHWIVFCESDYIYSYPLTDKGIGTPVTYKMVVKKLAPGGLLFANNSGNKLILLHYFEIFWSKYRAALFKFDNSTGKISQPQPFYDYTKIKGSETLYNAKFSANDSLFYLSSEGKGVFYLHQFEAHSTKIDDTKILIDSRTTYILSHNLQIAPDNKIYVCSRQDTFIHVIHYPNKKGTDCNYERNYINIAPGIGGDLMPNIYFPVRNLDFRIKAGCTDTVRFTNLSDTSYFKSFKWYFGDGDSSTAYSPKHAYAKTGKYHVKLLGINSCGARQWYDDSIWVQVPARVGFLVDTVQYSCGQATVFIKAQSADTTQKYYYTFGDSTEIDSSQNPIHIYNTAGKYLIKQVVSNGYCADSVADSIEINIEPFPQAMFNSNKKSGCTPLSLSLVNFSLDASKYLWLLPGNKTDTSTVPDITTTDTGFHSIKLLAFNNQGCVDTTVIDSFYVSPQPEPKFSFTTKKICKGVEVKFINQSLPAGQASIFSGSYIWDFGDGNFDTTTSPTHIYRNNGTYKVSLVAKNKYCQNLASDSVKIMIPDSVVSAFEANQTTACPNQPINLINKSTNSAKSLWYFGDGDTSTIFSPTHIWQQPGSYDVSLVSRSEHGCRDSVTYKNYITILPYPEALFTTDTGLYSCERVTFTYDNHSNYADSFRWNFGDGSPIQVTYSTQSLQHTYGKSGTYKVKLTAFNGYCIDSAIIIQAVNLRKPPVADFEIQNPKICIGETVKFTNKSMSNGQQGIFSDSYIWDFGDGATDTNTSPTHTYSQAGMYNVTLIATSKQGCKHFKQWQNAVRVGAEVKASFIANKTSGCAPMSVSFSPSADNKDTFYNYFWSFGNGKTSTERSPTTVFPANGSDSFLVTLVLTNGYCTAADSLWIRILNLREDRDTAKIDLVTVLENRALHLQWQPLNLANNYILYRSEDGIFYDFSTKISGTNYIDENVDVQAKSYWYKIAAEDACGGRSAVSEPVRSILLTAETKGLDEAAELKWNRYEGFFGEPIYAVLRDENELTSAQQLYDLTDADFYSDEFTGHCYRVEAFETINQNLRSRSNDVCLNYVPQLWIPNSFTPNSNGTNDEFIIKTKGVKSYKLSIYNRWGSLVYSGTQNSQPWNGRFENAMAVEGVYFYTISAVDASGKLINRSGLVTLLR